MQNRSTGTRNTVQKQVVQTVFQQAKRPLMAREAYELARRRRPRIGIATVYRAIRRMVSDKVLRPVVIPGETAYYEMADTGHHHYFHCCVCEKVYVAPGCPGSMQALTPSGFHLERHDLVLHGRCKRCNKTQDAG